MKSRYFNFVVHSEGRSLKGSFVSKVAIDVKRMTQLAAWSAQEAACEEGWEFDLMNFSVAAAGVMREQIQFNETFSHSDNYENYRRTTKTTKSLP